MYDYKIPLSRANVRIPRKVGDDKILDQLVPKEIMKYNLILVPMKPLEGIDMVKNNNLNTKEQGS